MHCSFTTANRSHRRSRQLLGLGLVAILAAAGCDAAAPAAPQAKPIEVIVTTPTSDTVTDYQDFTGRLDANRTIELRARVTGYVMEASFKEGDEVEEGQTLFRIDPQTYEADLHVAEANVKQAIAEQRLQERNLERAGQLYRSGTGGISREEYDQIQAAVEKSKAIVGSMEAARDRARLYVGYTQVTASHAGRVSRRFIDPGNLVKADDTVLTTIVADDPMWAYFDVDERTFLTLRGAASPGHGAWFANLQYPIMMRLATEDTFTRSGTVNFIDNRVTGNTGTIRMRGVFDNSDDTGSERVRRSLTRPSGTLSHGERALYESISNAGSSARRRVKKRPSAHLDRSAS